MDLWTWWRSAGFCDLPPSPAAENPKKIEVALNIYHKIFSLKPSSRQRVVHPPPTIACIALRKADSVSKKIFFSLKPLCALSKNAVARTHEQNLGNGMEKKCQKYLLPLSGMVLARGKKEPIRQRNYERWEPRTYESNEVTNRRRKRKEPRGGNVPIEVGIIL